ncbi:MAG: nucleotidyltransferase family protein [Sneathiella sp.]
MATFRNSLDILLLAAGQSKRMGAGNKLLLPYNKVPLIRHVANQILKSGIGTVTVVTGFQVNAIKDALSGLDVDFCYNPDFEAGQMSSVRAGSRAISIHSDGLMVALSDMPKLRALDYQFLRDRFYQNRSKKLVIPYFGEERGNPIIIPRQMIPDIASGGLKFGCRKLVQNNPQTVLKIRVDKSNFVWDIDTPSDYSSSVGGTLYAAPCC